MLRVFVLVALFLVIVAGQGYNEFALSAPYTVTDTNTIVALFTAGKQVQSHYVARLSYYAENYVSHTTTQRQTDLDSMMQSFCYDPYISGYRGNDGTYATTRAGVATYYSGKAASFSGLFQLQTLDHRVHDFATTGSGSSQIATFNMSSTWVNDAVVTPVSVGISSLSP